MKPLRVYEATCCCVRMFGRTRKLMCLRCDRGLVGEPVPRQRMKVILFERQFVSLIREGIKTTTLRPVRKVPLEIYDVLDMRYWTGRPYWSAQRRIGPAVVHMHVPCELGESSYTYDGVTNGFGFDLAEFARRDGFDSWSALQAWFGARYDLPFMGRLTSWRLIR